MKYVKFVQMQLNANYVVIIILLILMDYVKNAILLMQIM